MSTLLIRGISQLVTCDDGDRILKGVDLFCEGGFIRQIGAHLDVSADEVIDGTHMLWSEYYLRQLTAKHTRSVSYRTSHQQQSAEYG